MFYAPTRDVVFYAPTRDVVFYAPTRDVVFYAPTRDVVFYAPTRDEVIMSDDYCSYTEQLVPEGRRVFALTKACELADDRTPAEAILATAQAFEAWLMDAAPPKDRSETSGGAKPKIAAVKTG